jgi:membrane peptidoglycan carboxypeptidase
VRAGRGRRVLEGVGAAILAGVLLAGLLAPGALAVVGVTRTLSSAVGQTTGQLDAGPVPAGSVLLDAEGEPFARLYDRYREPVGAYRIADTVEAAVVAVEDRRFYVHEGVDWRGIGRALASNALNGSPLEGQGASTITMQYVKNRRLFDARTSAGQRAATEDTLQRKLIEAQIARSLERRLSKREILTRYLNLVYFGRGAYGVESAARAWFGTSAAELTVPQAALLAGMVQSPERFDPIDHPDAARGRRDAVLTAMVSVGALSPAQADRAARAPLVVRPDAGAPPQGCAAARPGTGFFCRAVLDQLVRFGIDRAAVRSGGYVVRTTLDPRVTARARDAVREASGDAPDVVTTAAVVAPEPADREVLALVADKSFGYDADAGDTAYRLPVRPLRGAGSVYKIFTAAAALERGLVDPDTALDVPDRYTSRLSGTTGDPYTVGNLGSYPDRMTLRRALALSPNTAFVELVDRLGSLRPVVDVARRLGLRETLAAPDPGGGSTVGEAVVERRRASFTLGPDATSPLELANVGATIAADGVRCPPTVLAEVLDQNGSPVRLPDQPCSRALDTATARDLNRALSDDHVYGTSADAAGEAGWDRPMIGKTGTTQDSRSAAFLGATDDYSAAVMTFATGAPRPVCIAPVRTCAEGDLVGGSLPARAWYAMMTPLHRDNTRSGASG